MPRLIAPSRTELDPRDFVVRESLWGRAVLALLMGLLALGWTLGPLLALGSAPLLAPLVALVLGGFLVGVTALLLPGVLRGFTRPHWVLRVRHDALLVDPRSYLNARPDLQPTPWLRLEAAELVGVRPGGRTLRVPDSEGRTHSAQETWIDLHLARPAPPEVLALVAAQVPERGGTRHHLRLVSLRGDAVLRIHWRSATHALRPRLEKALGALSELAPVLAAQDARELDWERMDEAELLEFALELQRGGSAFAALAMLRRRFGWSLVEAREFLRDEPRAA